MKLYQIYFSPTGGTKKVADILTDVWNCEKESVDLGRASLNEADCRFQSKDICLVAVPSFGGRVPKIAADKLKKMTGSGAKAIPVCVYGNRAYEDTLLELKEILEGRDFHCVAAVAAVAEHSILRQFATGRPDADDQKELLQFAEKIKQRIEIKFSEKLNIPGNKPYRDYGVLPTIPKPGKDCNQCGLCAKECPVQAIASNDPAIVDSKKCISCMRCTVVCPQQTRHVSKLILAAASQKLKKACSGRKENELF